MLDCLQLESRSVDSSLADAEVVDHTLVESWVETVDRDDFSVLDGWLLGDPVQDRVVMETQVVAHPHDYTVHLCLIKF